MKSILWRLFLNENFNWNLWNRNGHLSRQTNVIDFLLFMSNEIIVATTSNNLRYFEKI